MVAASSSHGPSLPRDRSGRVILSQADLDAYDPHPQHSGGRVRYVCPVHGGDHQRSLSVTEDGRYRCHSCGVSGTLKDYWLPGTKKTAGRVPLSFEEMGRLRLARAQQHEAAQAERLGQDIQPAAQVFLDRLPVLSAALHDPDSLGFHYLASRGLDPVVAADYGAGYAPPNLWPGDRGRHVGRIVYPLADPLTGRVVSAIGRLCCDADPAWPEAQRTLFTRLKQRKLKGCPAGIWPYAALAQARTEASALVVVEGPADALALLTQQRRLPGIALCGVADLLVSSALAGIAGLILAFDDDETGRVRRSILSIDRSLQGIATRCPEAGWLDGAKDLAALALQPDVCAGAVGLLEVAAESLAARPSRIDEDWLPDDDSRVWTVVCGPRESLRPPRCRQCGGTSWRLWRSAPLNPAKTLYKTQQRCARCCDLVPERD